MVLRVNHLTLVMFKYHDYYICTVFFMVLDLRLITRGES